MTRTLKLSLGFFATLLLLACSSGGGGQVAQAFASPDGAYVAILVSEIGNEFPGSSCTDTVVVVPRTAVASGIYPARSRAYTGACHTLAMTAVNGQSTFPNAPQLRWTDAHSLSIVFDTKLAHEGNIRFYSATSLYDGLITIRHGPQ